MWTPTDFSVRKYKRKAQKVGYCEATILAIELASRRVVLWPIVDRLCDCGIFSLLSEGEFLDQSTIIHLYSNESDKYGSLDAPFVADVGPGYILTETGLVTTDDGQIVNANLFPAPRGRRFVVAKLIWQLFFESTNLTTSLAQKNISRFDTQAEKMGVCVPLIPRYSDNYYHWLIETVPKIRYIREFEKETRLDVTYLVPGDAPSWLNETLDLLQVPNKKVEQASSSVYRAENLVLPSFPLRSRQDYAWIVETVLENVDPDREQIDAGSNIYISRSKAIERRVVNEDEVMDLLSEYGFRRYHLEDLSVEENITLFNEADIIIGAHGAGLTDLIYCEEASVIELFGTKIKFPYRRLSDTMGIKYDQLECDAISTDIFVDTEELSTLVERHL